MKQIPKWKIALRIISAVLYIIAFAAVTFCALRGVGAMAVILLMLGANAFLAVFCGVTASIALEEEREYGDRVNALLKIERLRKIGAPCEFYEFVDQVAKVCDKDHKCSACAPDECWDAVLNEIARNGKSNG